ncbi:peptidase inhibitor family I36 protein [Chengkuizengella sediminis]|uniref:peptidase inhibitor family I36 protein n=1 Tax=Chengkuizengella sediminis TaxID=1885917 RepID=UPI001389DB99|nr:beta/gamma crystallin family protein [Chengkuizengella sediminis]NDI36876.1 beta/gamma crystallin family protein [Chengkuizengella sediminis]
MLMFKKDTSLRICAIYLFLLITMSLFAATEVNAEEYVEVDYGTYQVYLPEATAAIETTHNKDLSGTSSNKDLSDSSSNDGYVAPHLEVPALEADQAFPFDTYENRTIFQGIDPVEYVPVNFDIFTGNNDHYYNSDYYENLSGESISVLNTALNEYDPDIDTFKAIYNPATQQFIYEFPPMDDTPEQLTLLLDKNSYFAQNLTLDVEEWWELAREGYQATGGPAHVSFDRSYGLSTAEQEQAVLTHGFGVETGVEYRSSVTEVGVETGWTASLTLSYNYSDSRSYAFTRTVQSNTSENFTADFGSSSGENSYKWAVYNLVTQTKVNYSNAPNFSELSIAFLLLDDYGLRPDMNSYIVKMTNQTYATMEVPIFPVDASLEAPQNLKAKSDFRNLTTTLSWDQVTDPNVEGFLVYKNDSIAGVIFDPSGTSWIDANIEPEKANMYWVRSFRNDNVFDTRIFYKTVSLPSNTVTETVSLTAASFRNMAIGCSIPINLSNQQIPAGERNYYNIYLGDPAAGGELMGQFEGESNSINLSPELYDLLMENSNEDFYIVQIVLYNGKSIVGPATSIPNNFTVTDTAFLYSSTGFNGDCITVSKDQRLSLSDYNFDNELSSMLVQGDVLVQLFPDINYGGYAQTIFTEDDGYAYVRDFNDKIIGADTVSSVKVTGQEDGAYIFSGSDYTGEYALIQNVKYGEYIETIRSLNLPSSGIANDDISSVKVNGPYAVVLYKDANYGGSNTVIKEDWGSLGSVGDNQASSLKLISGEGVHFFRGFNYSGDHKVYKNWNCGNITICDGGFPNDRLSSVLTIGNYGVALYQHTNYEGRFQAIRHRDPNLGSGTGNVGDNVTSSFKVFGKGVYLMNDTNYVPNGGYKKITSPGEYRSTDIIDFQENTLSSIFVVGYKATVYEDPNFGGNSEEFIDEVGGTRYLPDFSTTSIGNNAVSSIIVEDL